MRATRSSWPFMASMDATAVREAAPALPHLCQCGGLHSRICERGTKGCTCHHDVPTIDAGTVDPFVYPATCAGCGCTDERACHGGCTWLAVNRANGTGVCSNCAEHLDAWKADQ